MAPSTDQKKMNFTIKVTHTHVPNLEKKFKKKPAKKNLKTDHTTQMIMMMIMVITFIIMTCFDSNQKQINYYYYIHRWC